MLTKIPKLSDQEIQTLITNIELPTLLVALKDSSLAVGLKFRRNFSDSALEKIKTECINSMIFSASTQDIQDARTKILATFDKLFPDKK